MAASKGCDDREATEQRPGNDYEEYENRPSIMSTREGGGGHYETMTIEDGPDTSGGTLATHRRTPCRTPSTCCWVAILFLGCFGVATLTAVYILHYKACENDCASDSCLNAVQRQVDVDGCVPNPCDNGGTCVDGVDEYRCFCPPGFEGDQCQADKNECLRHSCVNGGTCVDEVNGYNCTCADGFKGLLCEIDKDECTNNSCVNGATCVDDIDGYHCLCDGDYKGILCEINENDCASDPCLNDGICVGGVADYSCVCQPGFEGDQCQVDTDDCTSNPCENGGTCVDEVNGYNCSCAGGFEGLFCEIEVRDIRLVNGIKTANSWSGRLEVRHLGVWGTVCDDDFGNTEAMVVCRSLGYNYYQSEAHGTGVGIIWMDDVSCSGSEQEVSECRHNGWNVNNCGHNEDVGVSCRN